MVAFSILAFKCKRWDFKRNTFSLQNSFCKTCQLVLQQLTFYLLYPEFFFIEGKGLLISKRHHNRTMLILWTASLRCSYDCKKAKEFFYNYYYFNFFYCTTTAESSAWSSDMHARMWAKSWTCNGRGLVI